MTTTDIVNDLYTKVADYHNISTEELMKRIVKGERLVDQYYRKK